MKALLRRMFSAPVEPVTHLNVRPAQRDHQAENVIREHRAKTAGALIDAERSSWEIRQKLASNVLNIVSGDRA